MKKIPKKKRRKKKSITFLNKEADSLSDNSGFGKSRWRTNGQIDKSGAGISESRSRWEETIDRGPCFVSYARESRSRYREEEEEVERLHVWIGEGALEESGSRHG